MNDDTHIAERLATAQPRDWPEDFGDPKVGWNVCSGCVRIFQGHPRRTLCRVCEHGSPPHGGEAGTC